MELNPLWKNVVVRPDTSEQKRGSIVLPDVVTGEIKFGEVMAVGDGVEVLRRLLRTSQRVAFRAGAGLSLDLDGEKALVLKAKDILGIVEA